MSLLSLSLDAVERGWVPDVITRAAIRQLCAQRLRGCDRGQKITNSGTISALVESIGRGRLHLFLKKPTSSITNCRQSFSQQFSGRIANTAPVFGRQRRSCWRRPKPHHWRSPVNALILPMVRRFWSSVVAGVRCRCGSPSGFAPVGSWRSPTPLRNGDSSKQKRPHAD